MGVFVIWQWEWLGSGSEASSNSDFNSESCNEGEEDHHNLYLDSDVEDPSEDDAQDDAESGFSLPAQTHIVTFKCMGTTYDVHYQEHLKEASKLLAEKEPVPVKLVSEPSMTPRLLHSTVKLTKNGTKLVTLRRKC